MSASAADDLSAEGPSFPVLVKLLATALVLAMLVSGARVAGQIVQSNMGFTGYAVLLAGLVLVLGSYLTMLRSRTAISPTHIRQIGPWRREVALADVSQAKLIHIPRLNWLITTRLMVRVRGRGLYTFYVADAAVLSGIQRLGLGRLPRPDEVPR